MARVARIGQLQAGEDQLRARPRAQYGRLVSVVVVQHIGLTFSVAAEPSHGQRVDASSSTIRSAAVRDRLPAPVALSGAGRTGALADVDHTSLVHIVQRMD